MPAVNPATDRTLRAYLAGEESLLIHCAEMLVSRGVTLLGVVSRSQQIRAWAGEQRLQLIEPERDLARRLAEPFDVLFNIAGPLPLDDAVLLLPRRFTVDFHDGPLPRYAGAYPTAWALLNRENDYAVSWYSVLPGGQPGRLLLRRPFPLGPGETSYTLNASCYAAAISSFGDLLENLLGETVEGEALPEIWESHFALKARPEAAGRLIWGKPAIDLETLVRALDFGPVDNPFCVAHFALGDGLVVVTRAEAIEQDSPKPPGSVLSLDEEAVVVATGRGALKLLALRSVEGRPLSVLELRAQGLSLETRLADLRQDDAERLSSLHRELTASEPRWVDRLGTLSFPELPWSVKEVDAPSTRQAVPTPASGAASAEDAAVAFCAFIARVTGTERFDLALVSPGLSKAREGLEAYLAEAVPLHVDVDLTQPFSGARARLGAELDGTSKQPGFLRDVAARYPKLGSANAAWQARTCALVQLETLNDPLPSVGSPLVFATDGTDYRWYYDAARLKLSQVSELSAQFARFCEGLHQGRALPLCEAQLLSEEVLSKLLKHWNNTSQLHEPACLHALFAEQAQRTPQAVALVDGARSLSFAELDQKANQVAQRLVKLGVGPDQRVGVSVSRSCGLVVAALGVLKAGGAYVPMDPSYPKDRLSWMLEDSRPAVLITERALAVRHRDADVTTLLIDAEDSLAGESTEAPHTSVTPAHLAYVIYTSGSTGRPKGVMVEHQNVSNFLVGMDAKLHHVPASGGTWLSVTSLSFDISVLEIFWSLTRGLKVVLHSDKADGAPAGQVMQRHADKRIDFSLMYFASDEGENASSRDKYKLLLEGARFGDANGFVAVWTPERHFHAFGGLYPNPSVAGAAIASITQQIGIRAASVVMPLHPPVRVAEEWALVDNLSDGRVGISFASGWQPNDFIIYRPERFEARKEVMLEGLQTVRALWRGEKLKATSPLGKEIEVQTLPRPVQKELPFWLTAAGNPETFRAAGEIGANLLTHLLGQTIEEVAEKVKVYREARKAAGHTGNGTVTIMLHTFVGPDAQVVKDTVREPMKAYLKSSVQLIKLAAWSFPTFKQKADASGKTPQEVFEQEDLSDEDMDALLEHSFNRYYETSGLFGTPDQCVEMVDRLKGIGVDEIGCLLDYGVPSATVLQHLPYINQVKQLTALQTDGAEAVSFASQVRQHEVTHFQCTPSQMALLLADPANRAALRPIQKVMVGGEAFPAELARELRAATRGEILNMYGPTETTIWSSVADVTGDEERVPLGQPIANTQLYVLDRFRQPVGIGTVGELWIGGLGVVRGYFERPELTDERFIPDPFSDVPGARLYRTGDLARYQTDGSLEFVGRVDSQIKLRGHRIELGEIEACLRQLPQVREAAVVLREDTPGDQRLVAYVTGGSVEPEALRARLSEALPETMVPSVFVVLAELPLTPNAKIDRNALPAPEKAVRAQASDYIEPSRKLEQTLAEVWSSLLNVERVGINDNFFDLGGHSLLTVQLHRRLKEVLDAPIALTDLFRFPTIRALVDYVEGQGGSEQVMEKSRERAEARKAARNKRAQARERRGGRGSSE